MALTADDRLDIYEVLVRYGFIVDDRDWPGFTRVFTPDAVIDFGGLAPIVGVEEIVRQYRDVLTHPLQHIIVNDVPSGPGSAKECVDSGR